MHRGRLDAGDEHAKGGSDPVHHVFQRVEIADRCVEWGAGEKLSIGFPIGDIDTVNAIPREELEDGLARIKGGVAVGAIGNDSYPNGDTTEDGLATAIRGILLPTEAS